MRSQGLRWLPRPDCADVGRAGSTGGRHLNRHGRRNRAGQIHHQGRYRSQGVSGVIHRLNRQIIVRIEQKPVVGITPGGGTDRSIRRQTRQGGVVGGFKVNPETGQGCPLFNSSCCSQCQPRDSRLIRSGRQVPDVEISRLSVTSGW